jgi:1,4-dihydroxy-6-naphthoate synthase
MVVSLHAFSPHELKGKRIAIPGKMTTAFLAIQLFQPDFLPVVVPFDQILEAVSEGSVDAGLVIHEAQLTHSRNGFHTILDLGRWWKKEHNLPLPLGANALLRSLPGELQSECCRLMRDSIQYSLDHREEALNYALEFARDMDPALAEKFVGMYVNHHTVDCGEVVPRAAQKLLDMGYTAGLISKQVKLEFVR